MINPKICLFVLGMHRSGTSALSGLLGLTWGGVPRKLMQASDDNQAGYWEPQTLVDFNDTLLETGQSHWADVASFDIDARLKDYDPDALASEASTLLRKEVGSRKRYLYKDPRLCRLLPFWIDRLAQNGSRSMEGRAVVMLRHPLEVARSMERRDGMTRAYGGLLWARYMLDAERYSRGMQRVLVSFDQLMDDWRATVEHIHNTLDIPANLTPRIIDKGNTFVSPVLKHHAVSADEFGDLPEIVVDCYRAFLVALDEGTFADPTIFNALTERLDKVSERSLFLPEAIQGWRSLKTVQTALHERTLQRTQMGDALHTSNLERTKLGDALHKSNLDRTKLGDALHTANLNLARSRQEIDALSAHRDEILAAADLRQTQLDNLYASRSWRVVAPLRRLGDIYRKLPFSLRSTARIPLQRLGPTTGAPISAGAQRDGLDFARCQGRQVLAAERLTFDGTVLSGNGADPQIIMSLDKGHKAGWHHVCLTCTVSRNVDPVVFFDFGDGLSTDHCVRLQPVTDDSFEAIVFLPAVSVALRLDPFEDQGSVAVAAFTVEAITPADIAERFDVPNMLKSLKRHGLKQPRKFRVLDLLDHEQRDLILYRKWIEAYDYHPDQADDYRQRLDALDERPLISVLMPVYNPPKTLLDAAIVSVKEQIYDNWQLCIADDASTADHVAPCLAGWVKDDKRIRVVTRAENGHISRATNDALAMAEGSWIALLDHDDELRPHALAEIAIAANAHPDAQLIYSDEDKIDEAGKRYDPYFKPDYSPDLLSAQNYFNHLTAHRTENVRRVGGWRVGYEGSQDYDLNLRAVAGLANNQIVHVPRVLYHWRATEASVAGNAESKTYAVDAGLKALNDAMMGSGHAVVAEGVPFYQTVHDLPSPPLVSLIIPTKDRVDLLGVCVSSILEKTDYAPYEIIVVDNGSVDPETFEYFKSMKGEERFRVIDYPGPFNYSAINNYAVSHAKGSVIGLINNDIEAMNGDWLREMASLAMREGTGCVGAKLYYPDDTIQHAGVVLGVGGVAGHAAIGESREATGYFGRLKVRHNVSAVTAACLLVRKEIYEAVGGLNEDDLTVAFNDVDFCLKVLEAGYLNVLTPHAELYHHESATRGSDLALDKVRRFQGEITYMQQRWGDILQHDRFYSPNLRLQPVDYLPRQPV